ncbi:hypothetical protein ACFQO4_01885 [Saliphagus sp. GCM10025334]
MKTMFDHAYLVSKVLLIPLAVLGVAGPFVVGRVNLSILGLYLALPMMLAVVVLWRGGNRHDREPVGWIAVDWRVFSIGFHLVVSSLVVSLAIYDVRPLAFFVGLAVLYGLIIVLIWLPSLGPRRTPVCLYHMVVAFALTVFSVTLKYDFFIGNTDLTVHVSLIDSLVETGAPVSMELYEPFQLWHVYAATTHQLLGGFLTTHRTVYVLSGVLFGAGVLAAYGFGRRVTLNERVALLTALFTIFHPFYTFYGMYSIPRSVTSIVFLALLVTLLGRTAPGMRLAGLVFLVAIVVYHPVSIPFVFIIMTIVYAVERIVRHSSAVGAQPPTVDSFTMVTTGLVTLTYWLYAAEPLVETIIGALFSAASGSRTEPPPQGVVASPWAEAANYVPYSFFIFFMLLGALLWLRDDTREWIATGVIGISALVLVPFSVPGPTLLLEGLAGINVNRFVHYTYMLFALTGAIGAYRLFSRGGFKLFVVLVLLLSLFGFTAVSNDFVARDNPAVERPFYTYYLTEQERQSYDDIDAMYDGQIETDRPTCRYMGEMLDAECVVVDAGAENAMFTEAESILIRDGELERRPLQFTAYVDEEIPLENLAERNRVYDSGSVTYYR